MIPVNIPSLSGNEKKYLLECIDSGWISSEGPFVTRFEEQFSKKVDRKYGVAVANGSVALDTAVLALELEKGDEVIMPTFTIISCAASLVRAGLVPVLVDSDELTWNIDVGQIESRITPKTKAIMVVHIYGLPVNMDPVLKLAEKYNLKIIEDAAEMHGQYYRDKPCGSFGDVSIFSFYPNKHITTGEGGMIVTNDEKIADKCRSLRNLCFVPEKRFVHYELGFNFRMTNLQAAIGVAQLEQLDQFVIKKREIGKKYISLLKDLQNIQLPLVKTDYAENIFWVFGVVTQSEGIKNKIVNQLAKEKIGTRPFFWCMHEQPVFQKMGLFKNQNFPVAEKLARCGFYLPSGLGLTEEQIITVADALKNIMKQ